MKKLIGSVLLLLLAGLSSCRSDLESMEDGHHRVSRKGDKHILKTIRMAFAGDCLSEFDETLNRAGEGQALVGINVFRTEKGKDNASEEKYAYGLFRGKDDLSIDVLTGYTYRFEASMVIDDVDKMYNLNNMGYRMPFQYNSSGNSTGSVSSLVLSQMDKFIYTELDGNNKVVEDKNRNYLVQLKSGTAYVNAGNDLASGFGDVWYPRVRRYYGMCDDFDPGVTESAEVNMAYKCFGLKFEVVSIPSGTVTVKDITKLDALRDKQPAEALIFSKGLELSEENREWEGLFSMNQLLADSETFNLEFTWHKGGSATEKFYASVSIKPKTRKVLRLNINGDPNFQTKGNISFSMESEDLTDEVQSVYQQNPSQE